MMFNDSYVKKQGKDTPALIITDIEISRSESDLQKPQISIPFTE